MDVELKKLLKLKYKLKQPLFLLIPNTFEYFYCPHKRLLKFENVEELVYLVFQGGHSRFPRSPSLVSIRRPAGAACHSAGLLCAPLVRQHRFAPPANMIFNQNAKEEPITVGAANPRWFLFRFGTAEGRGPGSRTSTLLQHLTQILPLNPLISLKATYHPVRT